MTSTLRDRALLVLGVVVLTLVPAAISLARPSVRWSEFVVMRSAGGTAPPGRLVEHVSGLVRSDGFQARVAADRDSAWFEYESRLDDVDVSATAADPSRVRIRVPATTRKEAFEVAGSVAAVITADGRAAPRRVEVGQARLRAIDAALRDAQLGPSRRRALLAERRFTSVAIAGVVPLQVVDPPSSPPRRTVEALIERIDESGAPRPSPLWAGLAGLMLGLALCCVRLARRPAEGTGRDSPRTGG